MANIQQLILFKQTVKDSCGPYRVLKIASQVSIKAIDVYLKSFSNEEDILTFLCYANYESDHITKLATTIKYWIKDIRSRVHHKSKMTPVVMLP